MNLSSLTEILAPIPSRSADLQHTRSNFRTQTDFSQSVSTEQSKVKYHRKMTNDTYSESAISSDETAPEISFLFARTRRGMCSRVRRPSNCEHTTVRNRKSRMGKGRCEQSNIYLCMTKMAKNISLFVPKRHPPSTN